MDGKATPQDALGVEDALDVAPDAIIGIDGAGRITLVNACTERTFGYSRDELMGRPIQELMPDVSTEAPTDGGRGYFAGRRPSPWDPGREVVGRRRDGWPVPLEVTVAAWHTEDGMVVTALADTAPRERLGADLQGILAGMPPMTIEHRGDQVMALTCLPDPEDNSGDDRSPDAIGHSRVVNGAVSGGSVAVANGVMPHDAGAETERAHLEAQLHQARRLESLGQLAGGVAHDFNNLLGVILNYTSFISEEVKRAASGPDGARWTAVGDDLEQIRRAAERATELTHQLLAFGRREVAQPQALLLNDVIGAVEPLLRRTLGAHIELQVHAASALWPVMADPGQFEQVLMNLVVNARQAMAQGGILTISTENTPVDAEYATTIGSIAEGRYVQLQVSDTGTGMDNDVLEHVFEPFFTTSGKGEASGLGLATVYGIVTQAGGHVQIYSEPGLGTTVHLLLPATDQEPVPGIRADETESSARGATILVVEDEEAMREVARRILTRHGHRVFTAANGSEALAIAEEHRDEITLLLTDVVMPHMLGKEVAERVRSITPSVQVVYMSGYAQPVLASQGTLDPGVILVGKPFSEETLVAKVREAIDAGP